MQDNDPIAKRLGLTPINTAGSVIEHKATEIVKSDAKVELDSDRQYARENFYQTIESGSRALEQMLDIAAQSQHPRAYEVVATLMKTLVDANKDLVDMSSKRVEAEIEPQPTQHTTNQMIFNGSTKELLDYLKNNKGEEK